MFLVSAGAAPMPWIPGAGDRASRLSATAVRSAGGRRNLRRKVKEVKVRTAALSTAVAAKGLRFKAARPRSRGRVFLGGLAGLLARFVPSLRPAGAR